MTQFNILIVEDESVIALELEDRLQRMGYDVMGSAASGESALRKIGSARPDVVLMDIYLQGAMDGIETAEEVRARYDIPVIYLTAYADSATLQRAKATKPFGFLRKPFREEELRTAIERAVNGSRGGG
jgi:CheY-like chemotaxis protein